VTGEGTVYGPISARCTDLHGPTENPDLLCGKGFLQSFSKLIRGFHDLLRQKPSSLFILLG
jgi:hypothetical protein